MLPSSPWVIGGFHAHACSLSCRALTRILLRPCILRGHTLYPTELQPNLRRGDFLEAEYGSCKSHPDYDFVESSRLCLLGAAALGLHDTGPGGIITMFGASNPNASHWPHGCYWMPQENRLFFNSGGRSHSEDVTRRSVCSKSLGKVLEV